MREEQGTDATREAWSRREPRWLDADQQRSWRALVLGTTLLFDRLDEDLRRQHGLSLVEYEILVRLSESDGSLRMARLAHSLAHSRSRVTHTVKRMENAGLVERCGASEDGRGVVCRMTERGDLVLRNVAPSHVEHVRTYLVDLASPDDFAAVGRVMDAVSDRLISDHPERELRDDRR
ncbi:MarR family winged helix-turn-helix transcriptional regulator [Nocardioides sp. TF02-7]|uniref:MarR family winged helix-turn-helix transcriptional regulator n=1 Tax=Nocardioides sp. TF02-7 TaxID=2917724 RepID=UPI001F062199|nr:MarR family winged helix-turn-helix transcriptional regulator [Nocardioides sp. TF02-7]UMG91692.1 MarR family winged helix-turn-helix transcriptional regulator [Nocardioides sp. TF02-7]